MGRQKITIKGIKEERIRQVLSIKLFELKLKWKKEFLILGNLLQKKKRTFKKSNGVKSSMWN